MPPAIIVENLCKRFGSWPDPGSWMARLARLAGSRSAAAGETAPPPALDGVSLEVEGGEILGIVGSNGAGKTTLLRVLCTLIRPDSGRASVSGVWIGPEPLGEDSERQIRRSIALAVGEERSFYWRLTGRDNLEFFAALWGFSPHEARDRVRTLERALDMGKFLDRRVSDCSAGMRQRLALARALLADPPVLLLDEPTHGLDPSSGRIVKDLVRDLSRRAGKTILFVTTRLDDAEEVCDRIAIMHAGKVLAIRPTAAGGAATVPVLYRFRLLVEPPPDLASRVAGLAGVSEARIEREGEGSTLCCRLANERDAAEEVVRVLAKSRCALAGIRAEPETIEHLFHTLIPPPSGRGSA